MTIKYLKKLKLKEENYLVRDQDFIFKRADKLLNNTKVYYDKLGNRIIKTQEQIDLGRLLNDSTVDDMTDYFNMLIAGILSISCIFLGFLLYIPLFIIWLPSEIIKILFSKTDFYEYTIYLPANIMCYLLIQQMSIFIYAMGFDGLSEKEAKELKPKAIEFAEYNAWYQFYKK